MLFQQFLTHQCVKPHNFNLSSLILQHPILVTCPKLGQSCSFYLFALQSAVCLREAIGLQVTSAARGLLLKVCFDTLLSPAVFLFVGQYHITPFHMTNFKLVLKRFLSCFKCQCECAEPVLRDHVKRVILLKCVPN